MKYEVLCDVSSLAIKTPILKSFSGNLVNVILTIPYLQWAEVPCIGGGIMWKQIIWLCIWSVWNNVGQSETFLFLPKTVKNYTILMSILHECKTTDSIDSSSKNQSQLWKIIHFIDVLHISSKSSSSLIWWSKYVPGTTFCG